MANSKFTIYTSQDLNAPVLSGTSGSLITVLSASLVTGYGIKPGAGWLMPFTSSDGFSAAFQNISGSGMYLSVEDDGLITTKEARIRGFETASNALSGSFQFPPYGVTNYGINSQGYLIARKSATIDVTPRKWIIVADAYTFYFFVLTTDFAYSYMTFMFGDFYSIYGSSDLWRCMIIGRSLENTNATGDGLEKQTLLNSATFGASSTVFNHVVPRSAFGGGGPVAVGKHGDYAKNSGNEFGSTVLNISVKNMNPDGTFFIAPVWIHEPISLTIRGRMRGFWHLCHNATFFQDGQVIQGTNDLLGKTFMVIRFGGGLTAGYLLEVSNTVETN